MRGCADACVCAHAFSCSAEQLAAQSFLRRLTPQQRYVVRHVGLKLLWVGKGELYAYVFADKMALYPLQN